MWILASFSCSPDITQSWPPPCWAAPSCWCRSWSRTRGGGCGNVADWLGHGDEPGRTEGARHVRPRVSGGTDFFLDIPPTIPGPYPLLPPNIQEHGEEKNQFIHLWCEIIIYNNLTWYKLLKCLMPLCDLQFVAAKLFIFTACWLILALFSQSWLWVSPQTPSQRLLKAHLLCYGLVQQPVWLRVLQPSDQSSWYFHSWRRRLTTPDTLRVLTTIRVMSSAFATPSWCRAGNIGAEHQPCIVSPGCDIPSLQFDWLGALGEGKLMKNKVMFTFHFFPMVIWAWSYEDNYMNVHHLFMFIQCSPTLASFANFGTSIYFL